MSQQNPTIPTATQAKGIDAAVNDLQTALSFDLSWLSAGMGRAYRRNKTRSNGASAFLPMVYLGTNFAQDFFNATPDNDKEGQSIILVGDATHTDFKTGFYGWLEYPISIIFSANLKTIDSALLATEDFTEHLMEDVRDSIRNLLGKSYRVSIDSETREFETVYSEFDIGVGTTNKPLLPMTYFRFECTLTVKEDCGNNVLDRCSAILQNLIATDLNECILPTYDFSDTTVQANVTAQQQIDLIDWLCSAGNTATLFTGTNDYVDCGNDSSVHWDSTDPFSVFIWYKSTSPSPTLATLASKVPNANPYNGWYFYVNDTTVNILLRSSIGGYIYVRYTLPTINDNNFHLLGFTYDGSGDQTGVNFYYDNTAPAKGIISNSLSPTVNTTTNLNIGAQNGVKAMAGIQKSFSMYGKELDITERTKIFTEGRDNPDYSSIGSPIAYLKLEGLNPVDNFGVNNGTSVNMDYSNIVPS